LGRPSLGIVPLTDLSLPAFVGPVEVPKLINGDGLIGWHSTIVMCWVDTLRVYHLPLGNIIRKPNEEQPLPPLETLPGPPTQPG